MASEQTHVTYEHFGAVGDGISDDLPAICKAHEHANQNGLPVVARADACYHLGRQALTAKIATSTDWNTARFTIDDTAVDDHKHSLFQVVSLLEPIALDIKTLHRDQHSLDLKPEQDCYVIAEYDSHRVYVRRGLNQNNGFPQHDCFILRRDGSIEGDIDWNYEEITSLQAQPIDQNQLTVSGGVLTTIANRMRQPEGYNYWKRNIAVQRSNTLIDGVTHYVTGETEWGHPYNGFLSVSRCADVCLRNCFATPHKIYKTIGAAGKPVSMGSYDLHANNVVNFHMQGCRMNHILDRTRWGVIGSNFCKNILLEDCELSRMDTHMGVSGYYKIHNCTLGWMGLNAIGRGLLEIRDSTLHGGHMVTFRGDYGSTWEGELRIRDSRWVPSCGDQCSPVLLGTTNDGMHDFGYTCYMPRLVDIDGLTVEDSNTPDDYQGLCIFTEPDGINDGVHDIQVEEERPFPYQRCQKVRIKNLQCASGKAPLMSTDSELAQQVTLTHED